MPLQFCPFCGQALIATDARFCASCGRAFPATSTEAPATPYGAPSVSSAAYPVAVAAPPAEMAPPIAPQVMIVRTLKSRGIAAALEFFIPGTGAMYAGQVALGFLWLFVALGLQVGGPAIIIKTASSSCDGSSAYSYDPTYDTQSCGPYLNDVRRNWLIALVIFAVIWLIVRMVLVTRFVDRLNNSITIGTLPTTTNRPSSTNLGSPILGGDTQNMGASSVHQPAPLPQARSLSNVQMSAFFGHSIVRAILGGLGAYLITRAFMSSARSHYEDYYQCANGGCPGIVNYVVRTHTLYIVGCLPLIMFLFAIFRYLRTGAKRATIECAIMLGVCAFLIPLGIADEAFSSGIQRESLVVMAGIVLCAAVCAAKPTRSSGAAWDELVDVALVALFVAVLAIPNVKESAASIPQGGLTAIVTVALLVMGGRMLQIIGANQQSTALQTPPSSSTEGERPIGM